MDKIYNAKAIALPFTDDPIGELYENVYIIPVKDSDGVIKTHLIQGGKFYIREKYLSSNNCIDYKDIMVDPETLVDITDYDNPIKFSGIDLSNSSDITFCAGDYIINE